MPQISPPTGKFPQLFMGTSNKCYLRWCTINLWCNFDWATNSKCSWKVMLIMELHMFFCALRYPSRVESCKPNIRLGWIILYHNCIAQINHFHRGNVSIANYFGRVSEFKFKDRAMEDSNLISLPSDINLSTALPTHTW